MKHTTDVIVAGLGAMGSAALYQLAKRGVKAIGIDQFMPPHSHGSSHGETRIIRKISGLGIEYTPLALRSYEIWKELEQETGQKLLTITGGLIVEADDSTSAKKQNKYLPVMKKAAHKYNISHDILSSSELTKRFPQFSFRANDHGYYEQDAGFLRPELCVEAHLSLAQKRGAQAHFNERILKIAPLDGGAVSVTTDKQEYAAQKLIVSAGPWISDFFPQYKDLFKVYRQVLYWFDVPNDITPYLPGTFPVFIFELADGTGFYGFPAVNGPTGGIKIASENYTVTTTPDRVNRNVSEQETKDMYEKFVHPSLPGIGSHCVKATSCLYTITPDYDFVIDTLPHAPQIILASPCSGHGFKFSAAIGEVLAELAINNKSSIDIDKFKLSRFGGGGRTQAPRP